MEINNWEELKKILNKGEGFVYNDFGTHENWNPKEYNKLHKASCPYLKKLTPNSANWTYYFDTMEEAVNWLQANRRDDGYCFCKSCLKDIAEPNE